MFSVSGIYSGLDVTAMVDALVNAERAPAESRLNRSQEAYSIELSAISQLKASLESFESEINTLNSVDGFSPRKFNLSDESVLAATVSTSAAEGTYSFSVDQLASRHQLVSDPLASESTIGTGSASFTVNGNSFTVDIAAGSDSLTGLRDAINTADDNSGVQAVIINDNGQQRLMLTSTESGADYSITADFSGLTGGSGTLGGMTELQPAQDASIRFGSGSSAITITSADNTLENIIDGVTLDLKSVSEKPVTITVALDTESLKASVQSFVNVWNNLKGTFDQLTDYNGDSAGALTGDAQVRILESLLRKELGSLIGEDGDPFRTYGDLGLKTTGRGTLEIDTVKLEEALANNFDDVANVLVGDSGLMTRLEQKLSDYLGSDGSIAQREDRINDSLGKISDDRADLEVRMERIRVYYQEQFLAMENMLASLSSTSEWLTNNLQVLNNNNE